MGRYGQWISETVEVEEVLTVGCNRDDYDTRSGTVTYVQYVTSSDRAAWLLTPYLRATRKRCPLCVGLIVFTSGVLVFHRGGMKAVDKRTKARKMCTGSYYTWTAPSTQ